MESINEQGAYVVIHHIVCLTKQPLEVPDNGQAKEEFSIWSRKYKNLHIKKKMIAMSALK